MAGILYASIAVQSVAALVIVPQTPRLLLFSGAVFLAGLLFFRHQADRGVRRLLWLQRKRAQQEARRAARGGA